MLTKTSILLLALVVATLAGPYMSYNLTDETIKNLLSVTPLVIIVDATNWGYYTGGLWKCNRYRDKKHSVLLVGYTADGKAWIIKNSWGINWGDNGYIYVTTEQAKNCKIGSSVYMLYGISMQYVFFALIFLLAIIM